MPNFYSHIMLYYVNGAALDMLQHRLEIIQL